MLARVSLLLRFICLNHRISQVAVHIDKGGHDCLPREVDTESASRRLNLALLSDARDLLVPHDKRGVFNRRSVIANQEGGTLEEYCRNNRIGTLPPPAAGKQSSKDQNSDRHQ